jgi:osmoprotectant transport system permease protein
VIWAAATSDPLVEWDWIGSHMDVVWERTIEHLQLTGIAVIVGFLISFPLAVFAFKHRRFYAPITWFTGILYTIPSLALFAILVPFTGLSTTTAEVGLVSYTLLIIIRNTVAGLVAVPDDVREAAIGMGYTPRQILWRVEIPLATPVIVAGLRIATVTTIGLVTVTAVIGKGGYGRFILDGLSLFFSTPVVLGATLSMVLAIAADRILIFVERRLTPWARARKLEVTA